MFPNKKLSSKKSGDRLKIDAANLPKTPIVTSTSSSKRLSTQETVADKRSRNFLELCHDQDAELLQKFTSRSYSSICQAINSPLDKFGNTALHFSVTESDYLLTFMLLLKGANPNIVNKSGISPIIVARRNCQDRIVDVLEKHGAILPVYEEKNAKRYGGVGGAGDDAAIASTAGGASTSKKTKNDHSTSSNSNSNNITITPLAQRISVPKKQQEEVNAKIQIIKGPNERRPNIYKFCRAKRLPCHQAAYLGLSDLLVDVVSEDSEVNSADEQNCSPLMKAAYHGHLTIVNYLLSKGVEVDALDQDGNTALVWACLGGHLDVVKSLIQVGKAHVDGYFRKSASTAVTISMLHKSTLALPSNTFPPSSSASAAHRREASTDSDAVTSNRFYNAITPLVAAVYENQLEIVNFLLVQNADLNTKIGIMTGGGKTAIMIACWMLHFPIVDLLLTSGATVDAQSSEWIKKGVISVKRAQLDQNPWRSADIVTTLASSPISGFSPSPGVTESPTALDRESLKEKMAYLSAEDVNSIAKVVQLISSIGSTISPQSTIPSVEEEIDSRTTLRKKKNVRRSSFLRQAINLEKVIGTNPALVYNIHESFPEKGTELDVKCLSVFQCSIQLVMAANKNIKHQYVVISAKASHFVAEIVHMIEHMEKALSGSIGLSNKTSENDVFPSNSIRLRVKDKCNIITTETSRQLMLTTRIAVGVWPPPNSVTDMIKAAINLANACKELVDLANVCGFFPQLDKPLDIQFEPYSDSVSEHDKDGQSGDAASPSAGATGGGQAGSQKSSSSSKSSSLATLNYSEYKRKNQLKEMEQMSKMYDNNRTTVDRESMLLALDQDPFKRFDTSLDSMLLQLVASVADVKKVHSQHLTEEYITTISTVAACTEAVLDEVEASEPFSKTNETALLMEMEDVRVIESKALQLGLSPQEIPVPFKAVLTKIQAAIRSSTRTLLYKGKMASGDWAPATASLEMLQATVPCLVGVKKLVTVAKVGAAKWYKNTTEETKKKLKWKREWVQNERVKKMFQVWEEKNKEEDVENIKQLLSLTPEESKILEDIVEGMVFDETTAPDKPKILKGGELNKIVSWSTSHAFLDVELIACLLMTHHSYTTSIELLDQLVKRYSITPPYGLNQRMFDIYVKRKIVPVRLRVANVLKSWIENYFEGDFLPNESLVLYFRDFVENRLLPDFETIAKGILKTLEEKLNSPSGTNQPPVAFANQGNNFLILANDASVRHHLATDPKTFYEYVDPLDMAKQMTCIDFEYFGNVKPHECLDQIWGERRKKELRALGVKADKGNKDKPLITGIVKMIQHTNHLTMWVATKILENDSIKGRVSALKYFAQTALCCREINNFNGVTGIVAGLSMAPVLRLYKTWAAFAEKYPKISDAYKEVAELVSPKGQYVNYRKALKELKPPAIPFLGVYLTDLTFIELGNPGFLPDTHYINFEKRRKVYSLIREIQFYQQVPYLFPAIPAIQEVLVSLNTTTSKLSDVQSTQVLLSEEELYEMSLVVEPRLEEDED